MQISLICFEGVGCCKWWLMMKIEMLLLLAKFSTPTDRTDSTSCTICYIINGVLTSPSCIHTITHHLLTWNGLKYVEEKQKTIIIRSIQLSLAFYFMGVFFFLTVLSCCSSTRFNRWRSTNWEGEGGVRRTLFVKSCNLSNQQIIEALETFNE